MVETHDPAGWYPDPTGKHELRYWDGFAWLDNVSDQGATTTEPLGGKPQPPPSRAAARGQETPAPAAPPAKSKTPIIVGAVAAAVVIIAVAAFFLTRGGDDDNTTVLKDKPVTFTDEGKDDARPTVHAVKVDADHAVLITVKADDDNSTPGIIVEADQSVVDQVNSQISDASDAVGGAKLKDACSNLREEDIGAKGNVVYFFDSVDTGSELKSFTIMPAAGQFEFVPVLIDDNLDCKAGKVTTTLTAVPLDLRDVSNLSDLEIGPV